MPDYLLGIDYGTGGAKACIIDQDGAVLTRAFEEYPLFHDLPGWSEHDAPRYWRMGCDIIRQCLSGAAIDPHHVRGVAVSSALPSLVMVDSAGEPIARAYNLLDRRAVKEVAWLKETVGEARIRQLTGNRIEDHPILVNLLWEQRNRPDVYVRMDKALTIDGFITRKLTGESVVSYGGAAFYGVAYDLLNNRFDEELLDELGVSPERLPALYPSEAIIGQVTDEAAAATGLAPGTPVAAGQVDFNASCIAAGITEPGDIMSNLGTVGNFGVIHTSRDFNFSAVGLAMINLAFTIDGTNRYITIPSTATGGQILRYFRDEFGQFEQAAAKRKGVSVYDLFNAQAANVPPGSEGLIILPYLAGERTPIWDAAARGVVFGLSLSHGKGHIVRAAMEGVAYALYDSFRLIVESGLPISYPLVMNEGGAVSDLWRQIITDVFNVPTVLVKQRVGAPLGDAILAGVATGVFPDYSVAKAWAEYAAPMEPDADNHACYQEYFALYKQLYGQTKDSFKVLAELRGKYA
ncbi:MAG: FGGY-family carbohydrate kinase [Caldilineaceae bacterium]|nr:FGGY-family carbohydrate kinase [Caldilineaceae bacterium]